MSAYDKLGLAMIPSGYKGEADENNAGGFLGKVYSVLPAETKTSEFLNSSTLNGLALTGSSDNTYPLYAQGTGGWVRIDFTQTITAGSRVRYFLRNGANTALLTAISTNVENSNANGSGNFFFYIKIDDGLQIRVLAEAGVTATIDSFASTLSHHGDFDFSRGSDATRVNSQGYIESVQVLSDELVQNGDFEDVSETEEVTNGTFDVDTGWAKQEGWTIADGVATFDYTTIAVSSNRNLYQAALTTNKVYKLTFDITSYTSGFIRNVNSAISDDDYFSGVGSYTQYFKAASVQLYLKASPDAILSIDNVSVKEVGQNWTFGDGWSITDDGGNLKATRQSLVTDSNLQYSSILVNGKKYRVSFDISDLTTGNIGVRIGSTNLNDLVADENKSYSLDTVADGTAIVFRGRNSFDGSIDNISVVEVTDDTDIPRLDYTNQACPSLLLEPQRSNIVTYSEDFSQWSNNNTTDELTNSTLSPEGKYNAYKIVEDPSSNVHKISFNGSVTTGVEYTISLFAKAAERSIVSFGGLGLYSNNEFCQYDLINGTAINTGTTNNASVSIENYGNGWYRCIATYTSTGTSGVAISLLDQLYTGNATSGEGKVYQGDDTKGVYIYGAQVEQGSYPTSYIPTNGSTVTRLVDFADNAGDSTIFNDAEGVLFVEMAALDQTKDSTYTILSINDGNTQNLIQIYYSPTLNRVVGELKLGGSGQASFPTTINDVTNFNKIAFKYKQNDFAFWINGVKVGTDVSGNVFSEGTLKRISFHGGNTSSKMEANVRSLLYFNEALTDAELEALTSSNIDRVLKNYNRRGELLGATYESTHVKTKLNELF